MPEVPRHLEIDATRCSNGDMRRIVSGTSGNRTAFDQQSSRIHSLGRGPEECHGPEDRQAGTGGGITHVRFGNHELRAWISKLSAALAHRSRVMA